MIKLSHLDKFNTVASFSLTNDDMHCLSLLYQPIIGSEALALYMTFTSLIERRNFESSEYNHSFLFDLLGISVNKFMKNRQILEAVGLLSTYKKDDSYIYLLCPPFTAKQFLSDGVLGLYLYSKVGEVIFNDLRQRFKVRKIDKNNYQNISASFDDVYEAIHVGAKIKLDNEYIMDKKPAKTAKFTNYEFDFPRFVKDIDLSLLPTGINEVFKEKIMQTAAVYGFDEGDMVALFSECIAANGYFDAKILKKKAKVLYNYKNNDTLPELKVKKEINDNEVIRAIENSTGAEFLQSILGDEFKKNDVTKLNELFNTLRFNPSVIKVMVMYCANIIRNKQDGSSLFPPISYFKSVEDEWILAGVTDVYDAYNRYILNIEPTDGQKPKRVKKAVVRKPLSYSEENKVNDIMTKMETL